MGKTNVIERISFSRASESYELPNLMEIQLNSYEWFLQRQTDPDERKNQGLQELFTEIFPIDFNRTRRDRDQELEEEGVVLEFINYILGEPKFSEQEARDRDTSFAAPLKVKIRLINKKTGEIKEQEVYFGDVPLMTRNGTFIINGAERVIVSQLHRSPGLNFDDDEGKRHPQGRKLYTARINPYRGSWIEFEFDVSGTLYVRLDKKKKISAFTFLRAWGFDTDLDVFSCFAPVSEHTIKTDSQGRIEYGFLQQVDGKRLVFNREITDVIVNLREHSTENPELKEEVDKFEQLRLKPLTGEDLEILARAGVKTIHISEGGDEFKPVLETMIRDTAITNLDAVRVIYDVFKPGELRVPEETARNEFQRRFLEPKYYDLGDVGRYKLNKRLGITGQREGERLLCQEDITGVIKTLFKLEKDQGKSDDTDHLGNRRVRSVGELFQGHLRTAFSKMDRVLKDKLNTQDLDTATPQSLISVKPITQSIKDFFATGALSQFMDQTNPISALTHKRRLSALGPGGVQRDRAMFEVRDIHRTHYGRICPIETPEGPNIGLIVSLAMYARPNEYGFLTTPYRKVSGGRVTSEVVYLDASEEDRYRIAPAATEVDSQGQFVEEMVLVRHGGEGEEYQYVPASQVDFIDFSPKQILSVCTSLIPFLEHDDANRALMGSNMQRQGVPLLKPTPPRVGTGIEAKVAADSGAVIISEEAGEVISVTADTIVVREDNGSVRRYDLPKYKRSNQNTCINYKPIVDAGTRVEKNTPLADGPATSRGELALGQNVLVAFMPWHGYNFEDAIVISERLVKDDVYTSIHIEKFEVEVRDTKLGRELITRDIPGVSEQALERLEEDGIIKLGSRVKSGDILVGKVTPKGEQDTSPEYKLLQSIFGEKAKNVKDTSLRVPHGSEGIVIDIKRFSREQGDELNAGVEELVKVFVATKRKISVGDKMAGRHGNKGVISVILPVEDMPYLEDGTPIDIVLNPLGVPSRMNIGQILETHLGWAAERMDFFAACPSFSSASENEVRFHLANAGLSSDGKAELYDGRSGEKFENRVTVGVMYMLKLNHLVDDKMHARSTGPYSLVTQQPLGGKSQFGGQRLGEMEVWALEAYGAAYTLQELLTVKSDDVTGRAKIYEAIVKGQNASPPGIPESFNVLVHELQGLALDVQVIDEDGTEIDLKQTEEHDPLRAARAILLGKSSAT